MVGELLRPSWRAEPRLVALQCNRPDAPSWTGVSPRCFIYLLCRQRPSGPGGAGPARSRSVPFNTLPPDHVTSFIFIW